MKKYEIIEIIGIAVLIIYKIFAWQHFFGEYVIDTVIIVFGVGMAGYLIAKLPKKHLYAYIALINLFFAIAVIHLLRAIYGGILC